MTYSRTAIFVEKKYWLILLAITLLAYWPLTFNVFSLKHDALVYFLPYRIHVSEIIQQGSFPWWSPYLYTGMPLHSDMQSGVWNPLVMIVSLFTRYNMTVLQWELLFYLFMASLGMYKLIRGFGASAPASIVLAIAYVCCGFFTDSGPIIPWITSAAWIPFVIHYFRKVLTGFNINIVIKLVASLSLLFLSGYPSYFIFIGYILLIASIVWAIKSRDKKQVLISFYGLVFSVIIVLAICGPAIFSWLDFLDYYSRGREAGLERSLQNHFPPLSTISYLLGPAVSVDTPLIDTDRSARNAFTGLLTIVFFIATILSGKRTREQWFILSIILFAFLFSLGPATPIRAWCYNFIPGMDTFRHPASMRLFCIIGIIMLAVPALDKFIQEPLQTKIIPRVFLLLGSAIALLIIILISSGFIEINGSLSSIKLLVDNLSLPNAIFILALIQLFFVALFYLTARKGWTRSFLLLAVANSIIYCWIAQPFTLVSQVRVSEVNRQLKEFPNKFLPPSIDAPILAKSASHSMSELPHLHANFYWKQITIQNDVRTPTISRSYKDYLNDTVLRTKMNDYPFIFFSSKTGPGAINGNGNQYTSFDTTINANGSISIAEFLPNEFKFKIATPTNTRLNLIQHFHHRWKAFVDGKPVPIFKANHAFMVIDVSEGHHDVRFKFEPAGIVKWAMWVSGLTILAFGLIFIYRTWFVIHR